MTKFSVHKSSSRALLLPLYQSIKHGKSFLNDNLTDPQTNIDKHIRKNLCLFVYKRLLCFSDNICYSFEAR